MDDTQFQVPRNRSHKKQSLMEQAIHHLLKIWAIEPVPLPQISQGIYSVFFLIPKKNGDAQEILDLKWLNCWVREKKFQVETVRTILAAIQKGDFSASIDLSEAYLHIPIR